MSEYAKSKCRKVSRVFFETMLRTAQLKEDGGKLHPFLFSVFNHYCNEAKHIKTFLM